MRPKSTKNMKKKDAKRNPMPVKDKVLSKFTTGRSKSHKKRARTLLLEYNTKDKANRFMDRRIGEKKKGMTSDDRTMARFVAGKVKQHNKKLLFNLGENDSEDFFTHKGRVLADVEKFEDPRSDDEDFEDEGRLDADFVRHAHFGGGLFRKVSEDERPSRQSQIEKLIADSKLRKHEMRKMKDETEQLTDKLNEQWKELRPIVSRSHAAKSDATHLDATEYKPKASEYDLIVNSLKYEKVGKPSVGLKAQNEVDREEKMRLDKLEKERLARMNMDLEQIEDIPKTNYYSADSLDDGFVIEKMDDEDECSDDDDGDSDNAADVDGDSEENDSCDDAAMQVDQQKITLANNGAHFFPNTVEELARFLGDSELQERIDLITNITRNSIDSGQENPQIKSLKLFHVLLQYLEQSTTVCNPQEFGLFFGGMCPLLFDLTQKNPNQIGEHLCSVMDKRRSKFASAKKAKLSTSLLIPLKIVPLLFPTSDFYHPVATPATAFLSQVLHMAVCESLRDVKLGLFACTIAYEYIELSNRYFPEAVNFLQSTLKMCCETETDSWISPQFVRNLLVPISSTCKTYILNESELKLSLSDLLQKIDDNEVTDKERVKCLFVTLRLISAFSQQYREHPARAAIWKPFMSSLDTIIKAENYPEIILQEISFLNTSLIAITESPIPRLVAVKKKPKALRLYEPNIKQIIQGRSLKIVSKEKLERQKLNRKYKQEMKGALKEIRKDRNFLTRVKVAEQTKRDSERKEKVKQILSWGQTQQGDFKRMERKNRFRH